MIELEKRQELDLLDQKQKTILHLAGINSWEWDLRDDSLVLTNVTSPNFVKYLCRQDEANDRTSGQKCMYTGQIQAALFGFHDASAKKCGPQNLEF